MDSMFGRSTYETSSRGLQHYDEALRSRANRNHGDDDTSILRGLPIRQWRQTEEVIAPPVEVKTETSTSFFGPLPPHRDLHLLPEISQKLLSRARQGLIFHNPSAVTNAKDDKIKSVKEQAEGGFVSKKWTLVARDQEAEEPSYLAKRRKGLPPVFGANVVNLNPQTSYRTTKVKKYDADGKLHVYEVLAPEGQQIEGEVVADDEVAKAAPVEPVSAAPGTVVEGVGVVNEQGVVVSNDLLLPTPPRRKPPPPRRKPKKGPGRGRKKVILNESDNLLGEGAAASGLLNVPGIAADRAADSAQPSSQADTPMPDAGDEDGESGSDGEDGEDGDGDGEDGREEGELSPSPEPETYTTQPTSEAALANVEESNRPVPTTEVKEEQKDDDAMAIDKNTKIDGQTAELSGAVDTSSKPVPTLSDPVGPPSPLQPPEAQVSLEDSRSSPELPLATTSADGPSLIPGLPPLASIEATLEEKDDRFLVGTAIASPVGSDVKIEEIVKAAVQDEEAEEDEEEYEPAP